MTFWTYIWVRSLTQNKTSYQPTLDNINLLNNEEPLYSHTTPLPHRNISLDTPRPKPKAALTIWFTVQYHSVASSNSTEIMALNYDMNHQKDKTGTSIISMTAELFSNVVFFKLFHGFMHKSMEFVCINTSMAIGMLLFMNFTHLQPS